MSGWGLSWFGGGSAQTKKNAPKNAILGLRSQLDMLQKREKHLRNQMDEQTALARKYVGQNNNNGECPVPAPSHCRTVSRYNEAVMSRTC